MHNITSSLIGVIQSYGLLSVFVLMTAESALIPIPSEVTMAFAGFLASRGVFNIWEAVLIGALGNLIGSLLAYYLGYRKGELWIRYAINKWGKWFLVSEHDFDKAKKWFEKYGQGVSFGSRMLPIVRTYISLPAGIARMRIDLFSVLTFLGSFIWSGFLAYLGFKLGQNWEAIGPYFRKFQIAIVVVIIFAVAFYIYKHIKRGTFKKSSN